MARRRMFNPEICQDENFLQMPAGSQALYFHLGLNADDDGAVSAMGVMRQINGNQDEYKILVAKGYIMPIDENGLVWIKHWHKNNFIRKDRYQPSIHQERLKTITEFRLTTGQPKNMANFRELGQPMVNPERELDRKKENTGADAPVKEEEERERMRINAEIAEFKLKFNKKNE